MGSTLSQVPKEGLGHPGLFYDGVKAAEEARFTVSELYFVQALQEHPGEAFWESLMSTVGQHDMPPSSVPPCKPGQADSMWAEQQLRGDTSAPSGEQPAATDAAVAGDHLQESCCEIEVAGVTGQGAKEEAPCPEAVQQACGVNRVVIRLPISHQLKDILDYYRLLADIALTYLQLIATTRNIEKVVPLAARYCVLTVRHTQVLLHCLALWKEENLGDGGGFIDHKKTRDLKIAVAVVAEDEAAGEGRRSRRLIKQERQHMSRTASLLFTLGLVEANCRYYHQLFLINYCSLLMREYSTLTSSQRQGAVYANALEHLDAFLGVAWQVAGEYPDEYISKLIVAYVPQSASDTLEGPVSTDKSHTSSSAQVSLYLSGDVHRHLYKSGVRWSPTESALIPLSLLPNVHLRVEENMSGRAQLLSPAERMAHHYTTWQSEVVALVVPGCQLYTLERSLPGFVPGKATRALCTHILTHSKDGGGSITVTPGPGEEGAGINDRQGRDDDAVAAMTPAQRAKFMKKCREQMLSRGRAMNTDLDLSDEHTLVMLCLDEVAMVAIAALIRGAQLKEAAGSLAVIPLYVQALENIVKGLHGPDAIELMFMREVLKMSLKGPHKAGHPA